MKGQACKHLLTGVETKARAEIVCIIAPIQKATNFPTISALPWTDLTGCRLARPLNLLRSNATLLYNIARRGSACCASLSHDDCCCRIHSLARNRAPGRMKQFHVAAHPLEKPAAAPPCPPQTTSTPARRRPIEPGPCYNGLAARHASIPRRRNTPHPTFCA